jgi:hypothetical protein
MHALVVDVGGTYVKLLATGQHEARQFPSGPTLTAEQVIAGVKKLTGDWKNVSRFQSAERRAQCVVYLEIWCVFWSWSCSPGVCRVWR